MHSSKQNSKRKTGVLLASLVLLIALAVAGTHAFLTAKTDPLVNTFIPLTVTPGVEEELDQTHMVKKRVAISNTGDLTVYVRAKIVVNWVDSEEQVIAAIRPTEGKDYSYDKPEDGWVLGADGYYYYIHPVGTGEATSAVLENGKELYYEGQVEGYDISMTILSQTIEAKTEAVTTAWSSGVSGVDASGKLIIITPPSEGGGAR